MTLIQLEVRRENMQAHIDIGREMEKNKNKWYHFEIRVSGGKIVDFVMREFIDYAKSKSQESTISRNS